MLCRKSFIQLVLFQIAVLLDGYDRHSLQFLLCRWVERMLLAESVYDLKERIWRRTKLPPMKQALVSKGGGGGRRGLAM